MTLTIEQARLREEARAFDQRIRERVEAGFVPDLRCAVRCEHFYKSFWRDPQFIDLYLGRVARTLLRLIEAHAGPARSVLDVGCGAGYISLELARAGHTVMGIDISAACIDIAQQTAAANPYTDTFGALDYRQTSLDEATGRYDVVLFSGALHHFDDPEAALRRALRRLAHDGVVLCFEPCHDRWRPSDAAQVALVRQLLAVTGHWFEPTGDEPTLSDADWLRRIIAKTHREYVDERDAHEAGQSPGDNACDGGAMLDVLRRHTRELAHEPGFSFIYRLLGGLRGPDEQVRRLAALLANYDQLGVRDGFLAPNSFYYCGRAAREAAA